MIEKRFTMRLPNKVADFVIENVGKFDELNAPNLDEGNTRFNEVAVNILRKKKVAKRIGEPGGTFEVHPLRGAKEVVVKRLRTGYGQTNNADLIQGRFKNLREQHALFEKYFGPDTIPYT